MVKFNKNLIIFMPSIDGGGVEKNLFILSNYLKKFFTNIKVVTFDDRFKYKFDKKIEIINFLTKPKKKYTKYYKYFICLLLLLRELKKKKSLVFAFQANIYCCFLAWIFNFNLITRSNSSPSGWTKSVFKNVIFKILLKVPKAVIVNSKSFKKEIDKKFNINSKLIYNPLNLEEIKLKSNDNFNFNFFEKTKIKAINVARFTDQKDHLTLLKALKILIDNKINIKLLIIGYGSNKEKMLRFIKNNKLNKKIKILNFKKNSYKYIKKSNLFILTSLYEGLPNVILEAMALKKYIISTDCPTGPREILKRGKYGSLVKLKNEKLLAQKIIEFSKNKNIKNVVDLAYKSLDRFDYDHNCSKYYRLINKFI
jgi:glycosyltransferase involved in cell wall biosynthesis